MNRERLADEQAALVRALVGGGPVPGGFDAGRVAATSAALVRKRAREVARAWPVLAAELDAIAAACRLAGRSNCHAIAAATHAGAARR